MAEESTTGQPTILIKTIIHLHHVDGTESKYIHNSSSILMSKVNNQPYVIDQDDVTAVFSGHIEFLKGLLPK